MFIIAVFMRDHVCQVFALNNAIGLGVERGNFDVMDAISWTGNQPQPQMLGHYQ